MKKVLFTITVFILSTQVAFAAPSAPVSAPDLTPATDRGTSNTDNITFDQNLRFNVECSAANNVIKIYSDAGLEGQYTCAGSGTEETGSISFPTSSATYTAVTYTESDGSGESGHSPALTPALIIDRDAPSITSPTSVNVAENQTSVTTIAFTDSRDPAPVITIRAEGGTDWSKFTLDPATGVLTFNTAPDYENPTDIGGANGDNVYWAPVRVTDSSGMYMSTSIAVTVTDVSEGAAPSNPSSAPDLVDASDSGTHNDDDITNDTTPTLEAVCSAIGNTLTFSSSSTTLTTHICTSVGTESVTLSPALTDGVYSITYTDTHNGGVSGPSPALGLTIDTASPGVTIANPTDGSTLGVATVDFDGLAETGSIVTVTDGTNTCSIVAYGLNIWDCQINGLSNGAYTFNATSVDIAGNTSVTATVDITINIPVVGGGVIQGLLSPINRGGHSVNKKTKKAIIADIDEEDNKDKEKAKDDAISAEVKATVTLSDDKIDLDINVFRFDRDLSFGMSGDDVTKLQELLTREGHYDGPITGFFGPLTRAGVIQYQESKDITPALGFFGQITRDTINKPTQAKANGLTDQERKSIEDQIKELMALVQELMKKMQSS